MGNGTTFRFEGRWKEELVVTGPAGRFVLQLVAGVVYLPPQAAWRDLAPAWAIDLWPTLRAELETWVATRHWRLEIDATAPVWPFEESLGAGGRPGSVWRRRWLWGLLASGLLACSRLAARALSDA